ncbi:HdeD family acid-resistance protein [Streptomyces albidochromogenes]|uniref:HdeD family acid-resistance protein n=1 Tax=Streptomyces albidochromogenes TaxID=329524 RepID=UPI00110F8AE6|nr:HdeD family acid-resistance protein [Streptomyces albidochromogenes]
MTVPRGPAPRTGQQQAPPRTGDEGVPPPPGDPAEILARLGRSWTWILGSAAATLVPGVLVLVWPGETLHVLAVLIGLYLLVTGAFRFVGSFARREPGERLPELLLAVLYVLAGVLCLRNPLQTVAALSLITGIVWLVSGILTLYAAIATKNLPHRGIVLGAALLAVVAGIVVLALPADSARALTRLLGLWLVLLGLAEVAVALAWRAALARSRPTGPPDAPTG